MQNSPNSPRPSHARQFGPTQAAVQSPAVQNVVDQVVPALLERHPVHTFDGTAPAPDSVVVIDPDKVQQEFEGWGTSLCWFANIAGGYTDPLRTYLADLLFDVSKGLGMQICRYNIGGAGWGTLDIPNFRYGANVESFWGPEGQWDFSRDANQRWMLLAARDRGACIFEAFSNSPPYWMTVSGRSSGNVFPWLDNLQPRYQEQFVHYLAEVVRWFHDTHGLTFRTIAPFNEPNTIYWWAGNNQEGCHFDVSTQNTIITKLASKLEITGLTKLGVGISASDETSIDTAVLSFKGYSTEVKEAISQYNTHSYLGSMRKELRELVRPTQRRLWMSEFGCGSFPISSMETALELSSIILKDLNVLQANAWVYWQAIENSEGGTWWGLMQVPFHTGRYIILGKQFYCLMQYSRFIRCGSSILHSPQPKSVLIAKAAPDAARPNQTRVVIVATNALSDYDVVNFDLSKCGSSSLGDSKGCEVDSKGSEMNMEGTAMIDIHRTSASENCQKVASMQAADLLKEIVQERQRLPESNGSQVWQYRLGEALHMAGMVREEEAVLWAAAKSLKHVQETDEAREVHSVLLGDVYNAIAGLMCVDGRMDAAIELLQNAMSVIHAKLGMDHMASQMLQDSLARATHAKLQGYKFHPEFNVYREYPVK